MEFIAKNCLDDFEIIIIDNSTNEHAIHNIKYHSIKLGLKYIKTNATSLNGSSSHSFAANLSYQMFKNDYEYFFYLDHDCFPIKEFSVIDILNGKEFAGVGQSKSKTYLWPGCLMFKQNDEIDFSPNHELRLDTGGNLYKLITEDNTIFFNEFYQQNPDFNKSFYNFYSLINDSMFMHFLNASGWNNTENNEERINSLINILDRI